jgi:DNA-directed RNA polymerase subunit RPC12/RpoP
MPGVLDEHVLPVACPKCGAKIEKTVTWLKENDHIDCPCGTTIYIQTDELSAAVAAVEAALARISRPAPDAA